MSPYTHEELQNFLQFVDKYHCQQLREFLVNSIWVAQYDYHAAELIQLSCAYKLERLFTWSFRRLLTMPITEIYGNHRSLMGHDIFVSLVYTKAILDHHRQLIAMEELVITSHVEGCHNLRECANEWRVAWWNGMGHLLLDGRDLLHYHDVVKRFKEMKFGCMSDGCQACMLQIVDHGTGFKHTKTFIVDICQGLIKDMHIHDDTFAQ
ncbi:hypothetical protein J3R83DRAFT_10705 [Lanmaoa asiatica]|nr:hypothetical protein J3R83DRAFT_10705 [Lanmaoa asiatica]